jgi:ABC-type glycerol-3-phosphate transport system permease component
VSTGLKGKGRIVFTELGLLIAIILTLMPIGWLFWSSLKYHRDIINLDNPTTFTLNNYMTIFSGSSRFPTLFLNSLGVVFFTTVLCVVIGSLAAYSLSKFRWPRTFTATILGASLFIQLVPPIALVPAYYVILNTFYLYNSVTGLILVNTVFNLPFAIFLLKVYFDSIPDDLKEAALVDGCKDAGVFWRVMLPLAAPGIGAVTILVGILAWNEFLMALSLTSTPDAQTITVGIGTYVQQYSVRYGEMTAAAAVATIPIVILAALAHRYIVTGLTGGAVKE